MQTARVVLFLLVLSAAVLAQSADTGTAHKAAATALLNSNNAGVANVACPATIFPVPTFYSGGGGPPRTVGAPAGGGGGAATIPPRDTWYAEGGQVFDNLYLL